MDKMVISTLGCASRLGWGPLQVMCALAMEPFIAAWGVCDHARWPLLGGHC